MSGEEKLIVYSDANGFERTVVIKADKRRVASVSVTFATPPERRQVERLIRGLEDGVAGAAVVVTTAETDEEFIQRCAAASVPDGARETRVMTREERTTELARRMQAGEPSRRFTPPPLEPDAKPSKSV